MALIDRIKFEAEDPDILVWKYPSDEISYAGQLIVNEGQEAVFFKEGQALDTFGPGTHTLKTGNIPILEKLVNLPFGGDTPFTAEVWYVRTNLVKDLGWGTPNPIQVYDPTFGLSVTVRGHGQFTIKITDTRTFIQELVGNQSLVTKDDIIQHFRGFIVARLGEFIAETIKEGQVSILELNTQRSELENRAKAVVQDSFKQAGVEIVHFKMLNIEVPEDDPSYQTLKEAQANRAKLRIDAEAEKAHLDTLGINYQTKRMMDIGQAAAQNEGGGSGMMQAGMGMGMGAQMGNMMGGMMAGMPGGGMASPGGTADPNDPMAKMAKLKQMLDNGFISQEEFDAKKKDILSAM